MSVSEIGAKKAILYYGINKNTLCAFVLVFLLFLKVIPSSVEAKLLFRTDFEGSVTLSSPTVIKSFMLSKVIQYKYVE